MPESLPWDAYSRLPFCCNWNSLDEWTTIRNNEV
jgi:hypothetical protein